MPIDIRGVAPYVQVYDMAASLRLYRDILGFELVMKAPDAADSDVDFALLRMNGVEIMLNTIYEKENRPAQPDPSRTAAHQDTAIYFSCPDVDAAYDHIKSMGLDIDKPIITHYGFKALTITDPDGYGLVFHWPVR